METHQNASARPHTTPLNLVMSEEPLRGGSHCVCRVQVPIQFRLGPLTTISIGIGLLARGGRGATYRKSNLPKEPIEIWGYEASPFVKLAREVRSRPVRHAVALPSLSSPHHLRCMRVLQEGRLYACLHRGHLASRVQLKSGLWCWGVQVLVELELPHLYHSVARNSPKRPLLTEKWGSFQVCFPKSMQCKCGLP